MLVLLHDPTSLASTIAWLRCQPLADAGLDVHFEGFDTAGFDVTLPAAPDQLAEHERLAPVAAGLGLDPRPPRSRPPTARAHLLERLAEAHDLGASWRSVVHHAFWLDERDLNDRAALLELAATAGLDRDQAAAALADTAALATLRRRMRQRRAQGVGGVPVLDHRGTLLDPATVDDAALRELAAL